MAVDARKAFRAGLVTLALGLVPLAVFGVMLRADFKLRDGPQVDARVVEVLHTRTSSKGPPETSSLKIRFRIHEGDEVVATLRTTRTTYRVGDALRISYDRGDPDHVRAVEGSELAWRVPLIIAATLWFFAACCFWVAIALWRGRAPRGYSPKNA